MQRLARETLVLRDYTNDNFACKNKMNFVEFIFKGLLSSKFKYLEK